jgi:predicted MFS family arabinose efflux permease
VLALCFTARVGLGFQFQAMGSVADPVAATYHLTYAEIGTLIGLFLMPGMVVSIPAGLAGRWVSDRVLLTTGLAGMAVGGGIAACADGFAMLAAGRVVSGVGFVLCSLYYNKITIEWFAGRELATAMAILVMSWPFGIALGQVVHGWLAASEGWRVPFIVASLFCLAGALVTFAFYRPPPTAPGARAASSSRLSGNEWILVLMASLVWALFNAAYVVYLSFAERVLVAGGLEPLESASIVSLASWVMLFSGAACGVIADRTGRHALIVTICLCCAMASLAALPQIAWAIPASLLFGLLGVAPAGLIVSLSGSAMAPEKRAFGMGVFLSIFYLLTAPAPALAGWLYDRTGDPFVPILFAIATFGVTLVAYHAYRAAHRALSVS